MVELKGLGNMTLVENESFLLRSVDFDVFFIPKKTGTTDNTFNKTSNLLHLGVLINFTQWIIRSEN